MGERGKEEREGGYLVGVRRRREEGGYQVRVYRWEKGGERGRRRGLSKGVGVGGKGREGERRGKG